MTTGCRSLVAVSLVLAVCIVGAEQQRQAAPFKEVALDALYESASPDGRFVVYHKAGASGRVFVKNLPTGAERVLVDVMGSVDHFAWSPDSRQLAYALTGPDKSVSVQVVDVAASTVRRLGAGVPVTWTDRGIYVSSPRDSWPGGYNSSLVTPDDGTTSQSNAMYLPGQLLAVVPGKDAQLVFRRVDRIVLYAEGSHTQRTATTTGTAPETRPVVSADGRLLAFASDRDGEWALYVAPIDRLPIDHPLRIASLDAPLSSDARLWWTANGTLALKPKYEGLEIYKLLIDAASGKPTGALERLTAGAADHESPKVSPDNSRIVFQTDRSGGPVTITGLAVMDANGGPEQRLDEITRERYGLFNPVNIFPFGWQSPDAALIYRSDGTVHGFASIDLRTRAIQPTVDIQVRSSLVALLAGTQEVLYREGTGREPSAEVRAVSLATHEVRVFAKGDHVGNFCATRDGRLIALFQRGAQGGELRLLSAGGELERILLTSKTGSLSPAAFSPDNRLLLYFDEENRVRIVNVESGESWSLIDSDGQPDWSNDRADWSPNGTFIVLEGSGVWDDTRVRAWEGVTYEAVTKHLAQGAKAQ